MSNVWITGANRGIGLELARRFSGRGDRVAVMCRKSSAQLDALGVEVHEGIDVSQPDSAGRISAAAGNAVINILVNNAGILTRERLDDLDWDRIRQQFEVNALGPLRVTRALLPNFRRGTKVAIITSRMGSVADNTSGGYYGYRMSKAAVNMAGRSLAMDLKDRGIALILLHPGMVATRMTDGQGVDPAEAARGLIERIDTLSLATTGTFWHANGDSLPW